MAKLTHYKNMLLTAGGTLGSRVLGLVRDQLIVGFLGSGAVASAVFFALLIPNLFRRLLGEGALTAAVVPVMSDDYKRGGKAEAFRFLNMVLTRAALVMLGITAAAMLLAWAVAGQEGLEPRYQMAAKLTVICMPYMPLICLAALFTAGLNLFGRFGITSLSAVWLNLAMIGAIGGAGFFFTQDAEQMAVWVCVGSLIGGVLQLVIPMAAFWKEGWRPQLTLERSESWEQLKLIFLPAVAGAGIQQINFFVSRFLALNVDDQSLTVYYLANRVVELPIGVFAITVSTVIFPAMALHAAREEKAELGGTFAHGMRLIFAINIPAAIGLLVLAEPIVRVLFQHGKFDAADTAATLPVLWIFAVAMPFYGAISLIGRALNSVKDTRTQAKIAGWVFLLNLTLSPLLGWWLKASGLALANLAAAVLQCVVLLCVLRRRDPAFSQEKLLRPLGQCLLAALLMGGLAAGLWWIGARWLALPGWVESLLIPSEAAPERAAATRGLAGGVLGLLAVIPAVAAFYFFLLGRLGYPESDFLVRRLRAKFGRRGSKGK